MKKIFSTLLAFIFVSSMCFAEETSTPPDADNSTISAATQPSNNTAVMPSSETKTFIGEVDVVTSSQIIVKGDNRYGTIFDVESNTTFVDQNGDPTTVTWLINGDKVSIEYATDADGTTRTAKSIKILSAP